MLDLLAAIWLGLVFGAFAGGVLAVILIAAIKVPAFTAFAILVFLTWAAVYQLTGSRK